jgi:hypothetical protein
VVALNAIQRQMVKTKYVSFYGKTIIEDFESEISGFFLETVVALFDVPEEFEAKILRSAIDGVGTKELKIVEILCAKDAAEIAVLKQAYKKCIFYYIINTLF